MLLLSVRELLDSSFLFSVDNGEKYSVQPMRFNALFKMTRVKVSMVLQVVGCVITITAI